MRLKSLDHVLDVLARDTATIGGAGTVAAVLLLLGLRVLLPPEERARLKKPLRLFVVHLIFGFLALLFPVHWVAYKPASLLSLLLLLASIGQSVLVLTMHSYLARGFVRRAPRIIQDIGQTVVWVVAALATLRAAGMEPGSLLTTSALLTAVLGLSLQDTLGNVFAGLSIQAEQPFAVGDWIQLEDDERGAGRVVEVNWRATKLVTHDAVELIIPNATLAKATIRNHSRPTRSSRRTVLVSGPYAAPPDKVRQVLMEAVEGAPGLAKVPPPIILTRDFADSGITYACRFWVDDFARRYEIEGALRDRIWYTFKRAGIDVPFPTRSVSVTEITAESEQRSRDDAMKTRRKVLENVDFLRALPGTALDNLARESVSQPFGREELIVRQGEVGEDLFVIESGQVSVVFEERDRSMLEVSRLGPGSFFGEMSLVTGEVRGASVRALEPTNLIVVNKASIEPILKAHPTLAETISEILAARKAAIASSVTNRGPASPTSKPESTELLSRIRQFFSLRS